AALGRASEFKQGTILALGGGTYAQPGCPEFLRSAGVPVLWLDSPIEVLLSRCMTMTGRPLFRDEASFRALHAQRLPSYQLAAHRVDSSGEPAEIVAQILRLGIVASGGNQAHLVVEKPLPGEKIPTGVRHAVNFKTAFLGLACGILASAALPV